jgi:hypothetical protein
MRMNQTKEHKDQRYIPKTKKETFDKVQKFLGVLLV